MAAPGPRLSFLEARPRPGFAVRLVRIEPGERRPYRPDEWADALILVEAGAIELDTTIRTRVRFCAGAVLRLAGLPVTAVRNRGPQPAILSAVRRQTVAATVE
jgi:hypothetical protein